MFMLLTLAVGWHEAFKELIAILADAWHCADVAGHWTAWKDVVTGAVRVD